MMQRRQEQREQRNEQPLPETAGATGRESTGEEIANRARRPRPTQNSSVRVHAVADGLSTAHSNYSELTTATEQPRRKPEYGHLTGLAEGRPGWLKQ